MAGPGNGPQGDHHADRLPQEVLDSLLAIGLSGMRQVIWRERMRLHCMGRIG